MQSFEESAAIPQISAQPPELPASLATPRKPRTTRAAVKASFALAPSRPSMSASFLPHPAFNATVFIACDLYRAHSRFCAFTHPRSDYADEFTACRQ